MAFIDVEHSDQQASSEVFEERSFNPSAPMNLLLRFETVSGPRTVIACSVPRQVAAEIAEAMKKAGHHADFVDRCSPLSIADRVMIKNLH